MPSASFKKQIEENNKEIILKKCLPKSSWGKQQKTQRWNSTEKKAQVLDLIKKACDKQDKKYRSLEQKYNKLQESLKHLHPQ